MRKLFLCLISVCLLASAGFAGCAGDRKNVGSKEKEAADTPALVSEDFNPGNATVLKTENGYYYYDYKNHGFRYFDTATGKEMFLCNKPECRHDGSEFCAATNKKYTIDRYGLYSGRLYAVAMEVTDTQYLYHLLSIALDGSELNEVVTYLTLEKSGVIPSMIFGERELYLHRNMALIPLWLVGDDATEYHGTAVINLETKAVTYLDEEPISKNNVERTDITAHGDYFYYCKKEGKKTVLHRYNIKNGSDETYKLLVGFGGNYVVQDENTIVYTRSANRVLCVHHHQTGENEEKVNLTRQQTVYYSDGTSMEQDLTYEAGDLKTDGEHIYVMVKYVKKEQRDEEFNISDTWEEAYVHIFDRQLNEVMYLNMAEVMGFAKEVRSEAEEFYSHYNRYLYFEDDVVYCVLPNANNFSEDYVYRCTKEAFLTGNPKFEFVYIERN